MTTSISHESAARSSVGFVRAARRHRLFHLFTPIAAVLVAACSAAAAPDEDFGSTESSIDAPDEESASSKGKSSSMPSGAKGLAATGLSCTAMNVTMPTTFPDVTKCINDAKAGSDDPADCAGWTPVGSYLTTSAELRSVESLGAQLYAIKPDATTLCLYLYRGDRAVSAGSLNGVHCYNTVECDVCWWDGSTTAGRAPTASVLKHASADGSKCSECHRNGPLLPKATLWSEAEDITMPLAEVCAAKGGPRWHQAEAGWPHTAREPSSVVAAPASCKGAGCHKSFARGGQYCTMIGHAFADDDGSMRSGASAVFTSKAECEGFRAAMGCPRAPAGPKEPFLDCDDPDVATP